MSCGWDPGGNWFVGLPAAVEPAAIEAMFAGAPLGLRRFAAVDLHVTVAFFGRLAPEQVDAVRKALAALVISPAAGSFEVIFDTLLLLPTPRRPTAIALSPGSGAAAVAAMITRHRTPLLAAAGRLPDQRPPLPHLTLARPPRRPDAAFGRQLRAWTQGVSFPAATVRLAPPCLFGWSRDRAARQFVIED